MSLNNLSPAMMIVIAVAILAIGAAVWMYLQKKKTQGLRSKFGPEYDKAIDTHKDRSHAESDLEKRAKRVAQFHIRPLSDDERTRYAEDWRVEMLLETRWEKTPNVGPRGNMVAAICDLFSQHNDGNA